MAKGAIGEESTLMCSKWTTSKETIAKKGVLTV